LTIPPLPLLLTLVPRYINPTSWGTRFLSGSFLPYEVSFFVLAFQSRLYRGPLFREKVFASRRVLFANFFTPYFSFSLFFFLKNSDFLFSPFHPPSEIFPDRMTWASCAFFSFSLFFSHLSIFLRIDDVIPPSQKHYSLFLNTFFFSSFAFSFFFLAFFFFFSILHPSWNFARCEWDSAFPSEQLLIRSKLSAPRGCAPSPPLQFVFSFPSFPYFPFPN